jgi:hypothetical protein
VCYGYSNPVRDGFICPRLRRDERINAIGFTAQLTREDDEDRNG